MRIIFLFLTFIVSNVFAISCPNAHLVENSRTTYRVTQWAAPSKMDDYVCPGAGGSTTERIWKYVSFNDYSGTTYDVTEILWSNPSICPTGQIADADGICKVPPPPQKCDWATNPPYHSTVLGQSECNNATKIGNTLDPYYLWNFSWCAADNTCYGRPMFCPSGQFYDGVTKSCRYPKPDTKRCPSGYYKTCSSTKSVGGENCSCEYVCKTNSADRFTYDVSCNAGPVDKDFPITNPDAPAPDHDSANNWDHMGECFQQQSDAKWNCKAPNVLSFQCDPKTGKATTSCKLPTTPTQNTPTASDATTNSTSKDIKELGNSLPINIRDALKDWFTDGSMPHLESIRGSMQAQNILQADANDKLDSISASADASLVLQSDANDKLDNIKTSTDGIKTSVDGLKTSVDSEKSLIQKIADFFSGTPTNYNGEDHPENSALNPDSNTSDGFDTFTNSFQQIKDSFDQSQDLFSRGVPSVSFGSGSCPSTTFFGHSVSFGSVGEKIAPYSPILSILIYITLMIRIFRFIFSFLSKGV